MGGGINMTGEFCGGGRDVVADPDLRGIPTDQQRQLKRGGDGGSCER